MTVEIKALTKTYSGKIHALKEINLTIGTGMFGLVGPNGAGKTTLMRIIAGLLRPTQGRVSVFGHDLSTTAGKRAAKSLLGYLPQELGLYPHLNAREFLDYIAILKGVTEKRQRQQQIEELLDVVRLTDAADRRLKTYSGGMKRRVGIAQALLGDPKLLVVDEPTVGLDPEERVRIRNLLSDMAASRTVILSTHIIEDISHSCNDLAIVHNGGIFYRGKPSEMMALAQGKVWNIVTAGERPNHGLTIVSTLQVQDGVQYRVLGVPDAHYTASPVAPSMEDSYIWLMHEAQAGVQLQQFQPAAP